MCLTQSVTQQYKQQQDHKHDSVDNILRADVHSQVSIYSSMAIIWFLTVFLECWQIVVLHSFTAWYLRVYVHHFSLDLIYKNGSVFISTLNSAPLHFILYEWVKIFIYICSATGMNDFPPKNGVQRKCNPENYPWILHEMWVSLKWGSKYLWSRYRQRERIRIGILMQHRFLSESAGEKHTLTCIE